MVVLRLIGVSAPTEAWLPKDKKVVSIASLNVPIDSATKKIADKLKIPIDSYQLWTVEDKAEAAKWKGPPERIDLSRQLDLADPFTKQGITATGDFIFLLRRGVDIPGVPGEESPLESSMGPLEDTYPPPPSPRRVAWSRTDSESPPPSPAVISPVQLPINPPPTPQCTEVPPLGREPSQLRTPVTQGDRRGWYPPHSPSTPGGYDGQPAGPPHTQPHTQP
eukprot:Sspe_Gene.108078::Locus_87240_Transcript_1_1_Confidence_1.000_Length_704::g.108078::m.108078